MHISVDTDLGQIVVDGRTIGLKTIAMLADAPIGSVFQITARNSGDLRLTMWDLSAVKRMLDAAATIS